MDNAEITDTLNRLISSCRDDEQGFRCCAARASHPRTQAFFEQRAASCASAAKDLRRMVVQSGGRVEWNDADAATAGKRCSSCGDTFSPASELGLIDACERREIRTLERYREAVEEPLPALLHMQLERQREAVQRFHGELRELREQTIREAAGR